MRYCFFLIFLFVSLSAISQEVMLYGNISDKYTGENLIGASLSVVDLNQGTVTDDKGEYSFSLPKGKHTIIVSSTGYKTDTLNKIGRAHV